MTGGNHLENLLSTTDKFESKVKDDHTLVDLLKYYETKSQLLSKQINNDTDLISHGFNVHVYENLTIFNTVYHKLEDHCNYKKIFIVHSHSDVYEWHLHQTHIKDNFFRFLPKTKAIIISSPKDTQGRAYKRYEKYCMNSSSLLYKPSVSNYALPYKIAGFELFSESNCRVLNSDLFMSDNGWEYLYNFLVNNFGIVLSDGTKQLHDLWLKMIDQSLATK